MAVLHRSPSRWRSRPRQAGPTSAFQIQRVLSAAPCTLLSDPEERARLVTHKLQANDPARCVEIVRNFTSHQRKGLADSRDMHLLQRATSKLSAWLAAQKGIRRGS